MKLLSLFFEDVFDLGNWYLWTMFSYLPHSAELSTIYKGGKHSSFHRGALVEFSSCLRISSASNWMTSFFPNQFRLGQQARIENKRWGYCVHKTAQTYIPRCQPQALAFTISCFGDGFLLPKVTFHPSQHCNRSTSPKGHHRLISNGKMKKILYYMFSWYSSRGCSWWPTYYR